MAEGTFQHLVDEAGLADQIEVDSVGTGTWHVGERPHRGTRAVLAQHGIDYDHRARQVTSRDLFAADYVIAMDSDNVHDLQRMDRDGSLDGKLHMLLSFAPDGSPRDVPDPYYRGNFEHVYSLVEAGCRGLLDHIRAEHEL
jgi:protein-tyrosine phosphatase